MLKSHHLTQFKAAIMALPAYEKLTKEQLLTDTLLVAQHAREKMYYAPHNEYVNVNAKVLIVGLTPGFTQMRLAIAAAKRALEAGLSDEKVCMEAKRQARFAGAMQRNLITMLEGVGLHKWLKISSCTELFGEQDKLLHTTSVLRYPVFIDGKNYSGSNPKLLGSSFLKEAALTHMQEELTYIEPVLIIPLGKTVESVLQLMVDAGHVPEYKCIWGFPHPSGANGHRFEQFARHVEAMKARIMDCFKKARSE